MEKVTKMCADFFFSYSFFRYSIRIFLEAISIKNKFLLLHFNCYFIVSKGKRCFTDTKVIKIF